MPEPSPPKPSVLVLFAHPSFERSRIHKELARAAQAVPSVTFHDLYEAYPDLDVDVRREQELAAAHSVIVWQHPLYWYSTPAILKQWQDLVLLHGWAFGEGGRALAGKQLLSAITTGGGASAYQRDGFHEHTLGELLAPLAQTAKLCGMTYLEPFVVHGTHKMTPEQAREAALQYQARLASLSTPSSRRSAGEQTSSSEES